MVVKERLYMLNIEDLISIISHFEGKLYGARSHKYKKLKESVKKLIEEVEGE